MVDYRNNGWVYYSQMHQIAPEGGAQGAGTHQGTQAVQDVDVIGSEEDIEAGDTDHQSRSAPLPNAEGDASTAGLCLENLLSIASGITSEDPGKQIAAVRDSVSFSQVKSRVTSSTVNTDSFQGSKHTFNDLEQSSQTSLDPCTIPSVKKGPLHGATPVSSRGRCTSGHVSTIASSAHPSKRGHSNPSNSSKISQAATVMSMAGAVNRMGDLVGQVLEDSPTPATPPPSIPTPCTDYSMKAFNNLAKDTLIHWCTLPEG